MTMMLAMKEVLRLVKAGQVAEATERLRAGFSDGSSPGERPSRNRVPSLADDNRPKRDPDSSATQRSGTGEETSRFEWHEVGNAAGRRRYKLYVPAGDASSPRPLLLMLHGCTQSPDDFAVGTGINAVADEMGVLVAYPEQNATHNQSKCWNWFRPGDQRRGNGEASLLASVVDDVARTRAIDRSRVFVAGLSAGGAAAAILAHEYPDVFKAVGVHSGLACGAASDLPSAFGAMRNGAAGDVSTSPVATIVFHGSADQTVNPSNAHHVLAAATAGREPTSTERGRTSAGVAYTRAVWRGGRGQASAESWTIEGAGHAWSGGNSRGSYTDPRGPDASRAMMRFFLEQA